MRSRRCAVASVLALFVALTGCGDDDAGEADDTRRTAPATADAGLVGDSWSPRSEAPVPATEVASAWFAERIWVIGGFDADGRALDVVQVYDPAEDSWSTGPSLPATVHHAVAVASAGALMVVGGFGGGGFGEPTASVWTLDPDAGSWSAGPPLPSPRGAGAGAWDGTRVVFGGGVGADGLGADVWALSDEQWEPVGELSEARDHLGAASDGDGRVWFMGGRFGSLDTNRATVDLVDGGEVLSSGSMPTARGGAAGFHVPGLGACLVGGESPEGTHDSVECVDVDGRTTVLPSLDRPRHGLGAAVAGDAAYVLLGGPEPGLAVSGAVEVLSLG